MAWTVRYHPDVPARDLPGLPRDIQERVRRAIEERLRTAPEIYGTRLRRDLAGAWKLRVGDYRIVYDLDTKTDSVTVLVVAHRSVVYEEAPKRRP